MSDARSRMTAGELYDPADPDLAAARADTARWLARLAACAAGPGARRALLAEGLAELGEGAEVRDPFRCDYGFNIRIGARAFLNFGCVILDVAPVTIGEGAQIGPNASTLQGMQQLRLGSATQTQKTKGGGFTDFLNAAASLAGGVGAVMSGGAAAGLWGAAGAAGGAGFTNAAGLGSATGLGFANVFA